MEMYETEALSKECIVASLNDAACDEATITEVLAAMESGCDIKGVRLLEKHRCALLDVLHEKQKNLDCLDYLLFVMRKKLGCK